MNTLIHADIFFFVTTIVIVILGIGAAIITYYILKIVKSFRHVMENIKKESDNIAEDIAALRVRVKEESTKVSPWLGLVSKFIFRRQGESEKEKKTGPKRKTSKAESSEEDDGE